MRLLASVVLAALISACAAPGEDGPGPGAFPALAGADRCAAVSASMLGATSASGKWTEAANGLPAFCEVTATLSPASGSNIGVVYRLPASWNGKVLGIGGGGWQGNITMQAASEGLRKGYATLQTDAGHAPGNVWDTSWASNPEALRDFSYRAVHEMTVAGKRLVADYYDTPHRRAYFQGCSTGGRMALMEAQRYPDDYDAISAGAPVYSLQVQTSAIFRNQAFARNAAFSSADLQLAQGAAVRACDAQDGLADGLINDPRACRFDPAVLQCTGAKTDTCLSAPQVTALRTVHEGIRAPDGEWALLPMSPGGEAGWSAFVGTDGSGRDLSYSALENLFQIATGRPSDLARFAVADVQALRSSTFGQWYEADDPALQPFFARGGKLLLWHGENDPGPSPVATNDYARAVLAAAPAASRQMRYFTLPGVQHCGGGPGAGRVAFLEVLENWDETGRAPDVLLGGGPGPMVRPHCAWPKVARYRGAGDANDPASWQCVARTS